MSLSFIIFINHVKSIILLYLFFISLCLTLWIKLIIVFLKNFLSTLSTTKYIF
ncbi:hypothetical protein HMPREF1987_00063 [Peptostreptococcaceae bacterium oral taxon 113 str. W5053]|nr:hypothetical protein HMPREF1987_00063 [Peptostreptococcaceae bacterium oral taxon 113 str. W5053]